jgi:hypothetical protein
LFLKNNLQLNFFKRQTVADSQGVTMFLFCHYPQTRTMKRIKGLKWFLSLLLINMLVGCGGGGGGGDGGSTAAGNAVDKVVVKSGVFLDSAVGGIDFVSGGQQGTTDANGTFQYEEGKKVRFSVGGVLIGESVTQPVVTPVNLVEQGDLSNPAVINIARFLQTLDDDGDPSNGISVSSEIAQQIRQAAAPMDFNVATAQFEEKNQVLIDRLRVVPLKGGGDRQIVSSEEATSHLASTVANTGTVAVAELTGRVKDAFGNPVGGVSVTLMQSVEDTAVAVKNTTATSSGVYRFENVPLGNYAVVASSNQSLERAAILQVSVRSASKITLESLQLTPTGTLNGTLSLEDGSSPEGVMVYLQGTNFVAMTDEQGSYTFVAVPQGTYSLKAVFDGYEPKKISAVEISAAGTVVPSMTLLGLNSPLLSGAIRGTVNQSTADLQESFPSQILQALARGLGLTEPNERSGSRCIGCGVKAWPADGASDGNPTEGEIEEDGSFSITDLAPGVYLIEIVSDQGTADPGDDQGKIHEDVVVLPGQVTNLGFLQLDRLGSLSGQISLSDSQLADNVRVWIPGTSNLALTDDQGFWKLDLVPEGDYVLRFSKDGYAPASLEVSAAALSETLVDSIVLESGVGSLQGELTLEGRASAIGALVALGNGSRVVAVQDNGTYLLENLAPGEYTLMLYAPGYGADTLENLVVKGGEQTILEPKELTPELNTGALFGKIVLEDGQDPAGTAVLLVESGQTTVVNSQGSYLFTEVPPGTYTLEAFRANYITREIGRKKVIAGITTHIQPAATLSPVVGKLAGKITLEGSTDYTGIQVTVFNSQNESWSTTTAFDGTYSILIPIGNYAGVRAQKELYGSKTHTATLTVVENGQVNVPVLNLEQNSNALSGQLVLTDSTSSEGLKVRIESLDGSYELLVDVESDGSWRMPEVPLGEYNLTFFKENDELWEVFSQSLSVIAGDPQLVLPVSLRQFFVKINNSAEITTNPTVSLSIGATGAKEMKISVDEPFGGTWEDFATTQQITFQSEGLHVVYVSFRDESETIINNVEDMIFLDSIASIILVTEDSEGQTLQRGSKIHFTLNADGETGGVAKIDIDGYKNGIRLLDDGLRGDQTAGDGVYEADFLILEGTDIRNKSVTGHFTDKYGNIAQSVMSDGTISIGTPPEITQVRVTPTTADSTAIIKWLTDEDATSLVEFGLDESYGTEATQPGLVKSHEVLLSGLQRGTTYHYRVRSTDSLGYETVSGDRTFRVAPSITVGVAAYPGDSEAVIVWSPNTEENLLGYHVYRSTASGSGFNKINNIPTTDRVFLDKGTDGLKNGESYFYKVTAVDSFGIESAFSEQSWAVPSAVQAAQTLKGKIATNMILSQAGNPWTVDGDILIERGYTLYVLPGTELVFQGAYKIRVEGEIQVNGTSASPVILRSIGNPWKGIEWIQGAVGATFNSEGIYQTGSALRHLVMQNAGVNGFKWLRVEKGLGLYLENVSLDGCEVCLSAEGLGSSHRISLRDSTLKNGSMVLVGGGLDLSGSTIENLTLNQSEATLMNRIQDSSISNSTFSLSQGMHSARNNWEGTNIQSLQTKTEQNSWNSNYYYITLDLSSGASTSLDDYFTNSQVQFLSLQAESSTFSNSSFSIGFLTENNRSFWQDGKYYNYQISMESQDSLNSLLKEVTLNNTGVQSVGTVIIQHSTVDNSTLAMRNATVEDSEFRGSSPLVILNNAQVRRNTMNGNPVIATRLQERQTSYQSQSIALITENGFWYEPNLDCSEDWAKDSQQCQEDFGFDTAWWRYGDINGTDCPTLADLAGSEASECRYIRGYNLNKDINTDGFYAVTSHPEDCPALEETSHDTNWSCKYLNAYNLPSNVNYDIILPPPAYCPGPGVWPAEVPWECTRVRGYMLSDVNPENADSLAQTYGAFEENIFEGGSLLVSNGLIRDNTVNNGSIGIFGTERAEVLGNSVSGAAATGLLAMPQKLILAHNQVTSSDIGLKITHPDLSSFLAYDNTLTGNRIGFNWTAGCTEDCSFSGSRFELQGNTERAFYAETPLGATKVGLVNFSLYDSWWGTTQANQIKTLIFDRFDLAAQGTNRIGLYPRSWTSGPWRTADQDSDGLLDWVDGDDDNDGYCDRQEDRESSPELNPPFFYSPLDASQKPTGIADCDLDGTADASDADDDGDGLSDNLEQGTIGTNPMVADTDGDGVEDKLEYEENYDPLQDSNYPMTSGRQYLSLNNVNVLGEILINSQLELSSVVLPAGTTLKFGNSEAGLHVKGALYAQGTESQPVVFTSAQGTPGSGDWGNITVEGGSGSLLEYIELRYSGAGGLIFQNSSATEVRQATFEQNSGGALQYVSSSNNLVTGSRFRQNSKEQNSYGQIGGLTWYQSNYNRLEDSVFEENDGSICIGGSNNTIDGVSIDRNDSQPAIYGYPYSDGCGSDPTNLSILNTTVTNSETQALYLRNATDALIKDSEFSQNDYTGETIYIERSIKLQINNTRIRENKGRGLYVEDSNQRDWGAGVTVRNSLISKNRNGGVYLRGYGHQLLDSEISENSGNTGSGIYADSVQNLLLVHLVISGNTGSGINGFGSNWVVENSEFIGNYSGASLRLSNSIFRQNKFTENRALGLGLNNGSDNEIIASTFSGNARGVSFGSNAKDNSIEKSNFVGHSGLAIDAVIDPNPETEEYTPYTATGNTVDNSYIAGNNGAADGVVDASNGKQSSAVPPQWQNVTVTNARGTTNGEAPRPPLQLKDITVVADAANATATIRWLTEVQSDSTIEYGTASPETGAVEWKTTSGGNGHFYLYVREYLSWPAAKRRAEELGGYLATITSAAEKSFVGSSVLNNNCCDYPWLGAERISGNWNWITGESWNYTNWSYEWSSNSEALYAYTWDQNQWASNGKNNNQHYLIEWNGKGLGESASSAALVSNHEVTLTGLDRSTLYFFRVKSFDAEGADGQSQLYSFRLAPLPPANVVAMGGDGRVDIVWDLHEDFSVAGFKVYGRTSGSNSWSQLNSSLVHDTLYTDTIVTNGSTYEYAVSAVDHDGNEGEKSVLDTAIPQANNGGTTIPSFPTPDEKGRIIWTTSGSPYTPQQYGAKLDNGTLYIAPGVVINDNSASNEDGLSISIPVRIYGSKHLKVEVNKGFNFSTTNTLSMNTKWNVPQFVGLSVADEFLAGMNINSYGQRLFNPYFSYAVFYRYNNFSNNVVNGDFVEIDGQIGYRSSTGGEFLFNTISHGTLSIYRENQLAELKYNSFTNTTLTSQSEVSSSSAPKIQLPYNYWGIDTIDESDYENIPFITNANDPRKYRFDFTGWLSEPLSFVGRQLNGPTWPEVVREDTKGQEVTFRARAYGAIEMMVSTDGTFTDPEQGDVAWKTYAMRRTIMTDQPSGTLYARFRDADGDESYVGVEGLSYDLGN